MNRLQSLQAEREFCVTLNRTAEIDPEHGDPDDRATPTRCTRARASRAQQRVAGDQRPQPDPLLRRVLGLGLSRGRRGERPARGRALRGAAVSDRARIYAGHDPPPAGLTPATEFTHRAVAGLRRPRRAPLAAGRPAAPPRPRRAALPPRRLPRARVGRRWTSPSATESRELSGQPARRDRSGCSPSCGRSGCASTR